jgi:uncharacterized protein YxjI
MLVVAIENIAKSILKDQYYEVTDTAGEAIEIKGEWFSIRHFKTEVTNGTDLNQIRSTSIIEKTNSSQDGLNTSDSNSDQLLDLPLCSSISKP